MRRALVPLALAALVASTVPGHAAARPKKPGVPACPSFTDPAKDDLNGDTGAGEDPALDIVGTKLVVDKGRLTVTLAMSKVGQPSQAEGAEYSGGFSLGGMVVTLFGTSSLSKPVMDVGFALTGISVDGSYVQGTESLVTLTLDSSKNTVTLAANLSDVGSAAGTKATGTVKGLVSAVRGTYVVLLEPYDDASSTGTLALGSCKA